MSTQLLADASGDAPSEKVSAQTIAAGFEARHCTDYQRRAYEIAAGRRLDGGTLTVILRRAVATQRRKSRLNAISLPEFECLFAGSGSWFETVSRDGVCVLPEFIPAARCEQLRAEVDRLITDYPDAVHVASNGSDKRIFGAQRASTPIQEFAEHPLLKEMCHVWLGPNSGLYFTMANRVDATPGNLGSGAGWHRDSLTNQFKAILYLSDVETDNGPYQYVRGSHLTRSIIRDSRRLGIPINMNKLSDVEVNRLVAPEPGRLKTFTAPAGSLIIADTTGIHRGAPLSGGVRYALTDYFYPLARRYQVMRRRFKPILGDDVPVTAA